MMRPTTPAALSAIAVVFAIASAAQADKLLFSGTHKITFSHNGAIKEVAASGTGVASANAQSGPLHTLELTRAFAKITETATASTPGPGVDDQIRFEGVRINPTLAGPGGHPGVFAPILAAAQGGALAKSTLPAAGTIRLCSLGGCPASVALHLAQTMGGAAIGPGVNSTPFTATAMTGTMTGLTMVMVVGHPWTVNTTTVSYRTTMGTMTGTFMDKGFAKGPLGKAGTTLDVTSMGMGGTLQLVSGIQTTCAGCIDNRNSPSGYVTRLTINFEPEPGLLVMLGAGAAGVALLGRTRARG
jgi:hypothetical protein